MDILSFKDKKILVVYVNYLYRKNMTNVDVELFCYIVHKSK